MLFPYSLIQLLIVLVIVGLLLWAVSQFPLDPAAARVIRVAVIVVTCIYLLMFLVGLLGGGFFPAPRRLNP